MVEALVAAPTGAFALFLWVHGHFLEGNPVELIGYVWAAVPVLAISNALPMLGTTAVLGRYSVSEKPAETMKQIFEALEADADRVYERKGTPLGRSKSFRRAMRGAPEVLTFFSNGEQLFTPRPNWDGVWFFPTVPSRSPVERCALELTYCAVRVVQLVHEVRRRKVALVGGRCGGTNGSKWFLEKLEKTAYPKIPEQMTAHEAWTLVSLAFHSLHYMREELETHRGASDLNERRATEFIEIFCEYMKWVGFYHAKALAAQWAALQHRYPRAHTLPVPSSVQKLLESITNTQRSLASIASSNLPRRVTAARVAEVRRGVFIPMLGTAIAMLTCLSLRPLFGWNPEFAVITTAYAYSFIAASLVSNFAFGVWLLLPPLGQRG